MPEGSVFAKSQGGKGEGEAEAGEDGAEGDEAVLRGLGMPLGVLGLAKEADEC